MSEIVLQVLVDENGNEMNIKTPFVVRKKMVEREVRIPLYVKGEIISDEALAELGLTVKGYTQDELDEKRYTELYTLNPDLAIRVREYKGYLDTLGLEYTAKTDDIEAAVYALDSTEQEKQNMVLKIQTAFNNISLNLEALGIEYSAFTAWEQMPKLIKYLPEQ